MANYKPISDDNNTKKKKKKKKKKKCFFLTFLLYYGKCGNFKCKGKMWDSRTPVIIL